MNIFQEIIMAFDGEDLTPEMIEYFPGMVEGELNLDVSQQKKHRFFFQSVSGNRTFQIFEGDSSLLNPSAACRIVNYTQIIIQSKHIRNDLYRAPEVDFFHLQT